MVEKPKKSEADIRSAIESIAEWARENRGGRDRGRRRWPPFLPPMPPAALAWLLSWGMWPGMRSYRDYDMPDAMSRFARTRADFWDHFDDAWYDTAEGMADVFEQIANATGRGSRHRRHPRIDREKLAAALDYLVQQNKLSKEERDEVAWAVRMTQGFGPFGRNGKDDED